MYHSRSSPETLDVAKTRRILWFGNVYNLPGKLWLDDGVFIEFRLRELNPHGDSLQVSFGGIEDVAKQVMRDTREQEMNEDRGQDHPPPPVGAPMFVVLGTVVCHLYTITVAPWGADMQRRASVSVIPLRVEGRTLGHFENAPNQAAVETGHRERLEGGLAQDGGAAPSG